MRLFSRSITAPPRRRRLSDAEQQERSGLEQSPSQYTYRRNQTLTGSRTVASASEQSAQRQSPRIAAHMLRRKRRRLGILCVGFVVAAAGMFWLLYQFTGTVHIALYGQVRRADDAKTYQVYHDTVESYLAERPLQRFRGLLHTGQLQQFFEDNGMHEVQAVNAPTPDGIGTARFEIKMREPIASWEVNGRISYVDIEGVIFDKNFYTMPSVTIVDESNLRAADVQTATSGRFLSFIGQAVGAFSELDRPVSQVILPADTTRQVVGVVGDYRVKLSVDRPAGEQVEDAVRAVTYLQRQGVKTEYVDVRVSNKAYYR